jgi:hypothetical protein
LLGPTGKKKRDNKGVSGPQILKKIAIGVYRPRKKWLTAVLLENTRKLYRDNTL